MEILLIDLDSKIPNPPLMKLSAWHKAQGNNVRLIKNPDKVYISCVFPQNKSKIEMGGYGISSVQLPDEIEHTRPDYSLYNCDFSMGFTSRGCIRKCPWCIVPKMEGPIRDHAPISEFLHPDHNKVILLDNNFLASPRWRENLQFLINNHLKVSFCQGLDIRLINEENAAMLAKCLHYSIKFTERRIYFAFDDIKIEKQVRRGVEILKRAGIPAGRLMFYMLCGFEEPYDFGNDWKRFKILLELGVDPYVMKYNKRRDIRILNHFSRWVIRRDYKRNQPKYLRPHEWRELQDAISSFGGDINGWA